MKTVYVLGAGFSIPAGGPPQDGILKEILGLKENNATTSDCKRTLNKFLKGTWNAQANYRSQLSLEDLYTTIDRCLADSISLRGMTQIQLLQLRSSLEYLVSRAIDQHIKKFRNPANSYVDTFANFLVKSASHRSRLAKAETNATLARQYDPFAIISLNWDILLDHAIHQELERQDDGLSGDYDPIGVLDYCCHISSFQEDDPRVRPGLWALGSKGYIVKLLKLHGSMNWLQCPNCQRLFVGFERKLIEPGRVHGFHCRHCRRHGHQCVLRGSLVMPTFLKDLNNFQIKLVWQNAGIELMEARKVVFIGYSLPHADFEFRQVLSRMVHKEAAIEVVLYEGHSDEQRSRFQQETARYRQFFGGRHISFDGGGVVQFIEGLQRKASSIITPAHDGRHHAH